MKKIFTGLLIALGIAVAALFYSEFLSKELQKNEVPESSIRNEERPKQKISAKELQVNQRHHKRYFSSKPGTKSSSAVSSYANGNVQGSWDQVRFLAPEKHSYGFRVDGSVYDQYNDILYAISYAGHIWKINRQSDDYSKTQWELINHKSNFKTSFIEGINRDGGLFRMVRSSGTTMQYSDDEGRTWSIASGVQFAEATYEGAAVKTITGNRIFVAGKTSSGTVKVFLSSNNGENYSTLSPSFNAGTYNVKVFKPCFSESVFLAAFNQSSKKISIYECAAGYSDFKLIYTPSNIFTPPTRVFGTYFNEKFHFYIAGTNTHIYYSDDKGATWQTKSSTNDVSPKTVHPAKPNIIFKGFTDVNVSTNYGSTFSNFSHLLGWDVQHMKMYQKKDGSYFHFIGKDFGCYISDKPEIATEYVQLNNSAPIQMCYDADHSQNYYSSFSATQDRGTIGYVSTSSQTLTNDVRTTDGLRVTLGNNETSVWTWMYFGTLYHTSNFAARNSSLTNKNWTGKWWAAPMISSPNVREDAVYIAAGSRLKKFTYNPEQETIVETDHYFDFLEKTGSPITGFGYSPLNRNLWYASVQNGKFLYSVDGGQTFKQTSYTGALPLANDQQYNYSKNQHIIKASKLQEKRVYYAGVGNLFMISDDGGKTFTNHSSGLDVYRIRDFDFSPDEKFIFAACAYGGIWVYVVDSDQWHEMNDEAVPFVDFTDVEYIVKENTVNFASFGNGILRFKIDGPNQALLYPDSLLAKITGTNLVNLRWNDKSGNEDGFIIERSVNGVFTPIKNLPVNQISYTDSSIVEPGIYYYRVKAFTSANESYYSNYAAVEVKPPGEVSKKDWRLVSVDSEALNGYGAALAFDENASTMWHTQWGINPLPNHPHNLLIDMNDTLNLYGFAYLPRQDDNWNGTISNYEFYISMDNMNWIKMASGTWQKSFDKKEVYFPTSQEARYIKLVSLSEVNGSAFTSCAEIAAITQLPSSIVPKAPQFVQGGRLSDSEIELIWLDLSDDEDGFVIEQLSEGSFTAIHTSGVDATTFELQNTSINNTYTFRLAAYNHVGFSGYSDTLTIYKAGKVVNVHEKFRNENNIMVYPNPFENELKFRLEGIELYSAWQILNLSGEVLKKGRIPEYGNSETINVQDLRTGYYIMQFKGENRWISKIIVKK